MRICVDIRSLFVYFGGMIQVEFDSHKLKNFLSRLESEQVPFATSRALNDTAEEIKLKTIADLDKVFTIRNQWVKRGMRVIRSSKDQWPNTTAQVGHLDKYMALQETGGNKKGVVPIEARPSKTDITPPSKWPGKLMEQGVKAVAGKRRRGSAVKRVFIADLKRNNKPGLWIVKGRDGVPRLMYRFEKEVKVPARWGFVDKAETIAAASMQDNFNKRLAEAVNSVK